MAVSPSTMARCRPGGGRFQRRRLLYGGLPLIRGLHGSIRATVHPFDIRGMKGLAVLDSISLDGRSTVVSAYSTR